MSRDIFAPESLYQLKYSIPPEDITLDNSY